MGRLEGSPQARFIQMMKKYGHNTDVVLHVAKVTSTSPFSIRIPNDQFDIEEDSLIITETANEKASVGDDVVVIEVNGGQLYYVLDKVVG